MEQLSNLCVFVAKPKSQTANDDTYGMNVTWRVELRAYAFYHIVRLYGKIPQKRIGQIPICRH